MFTASPDPVSPDESHARTCVSAPITIESREGSIARSTGQPGTVGGRTGLDLDELERLDQLDQLDRLDLLDQLDELDELDELERDDDWMDEAGCKGRTNLFFGLAGERPERRLRRERAARNLCAACPVLEPCRERARAGRENGFWGGESEEERAAAGFPPRSISRRAVQRASGLRVVAS